MLLRQYSETKPRRLNHFEPKFSSLICLVMFGLLCFGFACDDCAKELVQFLWKPSSRRLLSACHEHLSKFFYHTRAKRTETCPKSLDATWCNPSLLGIGYKKRLRLVKVQRSRGVQPAHWLFQHGSCTDPPGAGPAHGKGAVWQRKKNHHAKSSSAAMVGNAMCRQLKTTLKMKIPPAAFKGQCFFLVGDCKS